MKVTKILCLGMAVLMVCTNLPQMQIWAKNVSEKKIQIDQEMEGERAKIISLTGKKNDSATKQ